MLIKKDTDIKYLKRNFQFIAQLARIRSGKVWKSGSPLDGLPANLRFVRNKLKLDFSDPRIIAPVPIRFKEYKGHVLKSAIGSFLLENLHIESRGLGQFTGSASKFSSAGFRKSRRLYFRLLIPVDKELAFHWLIKHTRFSADYGIRSALATDFQVDGVKFKLYSAKKAEQNYAVIDSYSKLQLKEFEKYSFAILVSYGYLSGTMPGDKAYNFGYTRKVMKEPSFFMYETIRHSTTSSYRPLSANAFGWMREKSAKAKAIHDSLREFSCEEFGRLCEKAHTSIEFSSVLLLIIESSVASLLFMPGGYAIALESLSKIISGGGKSHLAPISDRALNSKVVSKCHSIIEKHCSAIVSRESTEIIKARITSSLNSPTNEALLQAPFKKLRIELLAEDIALLKTRNLLLHGKVPDITKAGKSRTVKRMNLDMYYCALRYYTLLNMLILKWIGYDNQVLNYPKLQEKYTKIPLPKESPFRRVGPV